MSQSRKTDGYRVAITISIKEGGDLAFFSNGLRQNVVFLYNLFKASKACARVFLTSESPPPIKPESKDFGVDRGDIVPVSTIMDDIDYLIVLGSFLKVETLKALRAKGVKVINYKGGNGAVISMESIVADPPKEAAETYPDYDCYDEVWMTPQHIATYAGWCRTVYRCPVYEVPQIWSPLFAGVLDGSSARFGYAPPEAGWRVGVLDPNTTVMKTSHLPMLVAEVAHRQAPDLIRQLLVSNARQFSDVPHFKRFTNLLTLHKDKRLTVEDRFVSYSFIARHCDAVITHHWENGLNYLYYEVLWGGYPLVHNSEFLEDYGYYYETFDAASGAAALIEARRVHDASLADYRKANDRLFAVLEPTSEANIQLHEALLFA